MSSSSSDGDDLLVLVLDRQRKRRRSRGSRTIWAKEWISRRGTQGAYCNLIRELSVEDPSMYNAYHRLNVDSFNAILAMVGPTIAKMDTNMRECITPGERLAVTLRFLATGKSHLLCATIC